MTTTMQVWPDQPLCDRTARIVRDHRIDRSESLLHVRHHPCPDVRIRMVGAEVRRNLRNGRVGADQCHEGVGGDKLPHDGGERHAATGHDEHSPG